MDLTHYLNDALMNKVGLAHRPVTGLVGGVNPTKIDLVLV